MGGSSTRARSAPAAGVGAWFMNSGMIAVPERDLGYLLLHSLTCPLLFLTLSNIPTPQVAQGLY